MVHIDYYFSTISPYTYLAGRRLEDLAAAHRAQIAYKPLDMLALFARTGGLPPRERHPNRIKYRAQDLPRQAKKAGLPFNLNPAYAPANAAPSCYACIVAAKAGGGDMGALIHAIGRAYWAEEKDIAQDDVIAACLAEAGFDPSLAGKDMLMAAETYMANLEEAVAAGVFGAPFYIVNNDQGFWGQDRLADLALHLAGEL